MIDAAGALEEVVAMRNRTVTPLPLLLVGAALLLGAIAYALSGIVPAL